MIWLKKWAPLKKDRYYHNVGQGNGDAQLKRQIMGRKVIVANTGGKMYMDCILIKSQNPDNKNLGYKRIKKSISTSIALSNIPKNSEMITIMCYNEKGYKKYCKNYKDY